MPESSAPSSAFPAISSGGPREIRKAAQRRSASRPQVALLIETSNAYARGLLEGVAAYLREHQAWSIYLSEHGRGAAAPQWLAGWTGDGIIARVENPEIARAVGRRGLPTVDLSAARLLKNVPCVETDNRAIAELAAQHLLDRGFKHLGFCGLEDYQWSLARLEHFRKAAADAGLQCHAHMVSQQGERAAAWATDHAELAAWAMGLPKPIGILACFDIRGRQLLDACRTAGIRVPDDVAVVGVDNDALLCELADPPLSSVAPDTHRTGYIAAELLEKMMRARRVEPIVRLIRPLGLIARKSSDSLAIDDPDVSAALRLIREHFHERLDVIQLLKQVPMSRRVLEARFKKLLGRSPHQEILRCRIARIKQLLADTDLPLKTIAQRSGVPHPEYLSVTFKRLTGRTPSEYRRAMRDLSMNAGDS